MQNLGEATGGGGKGGWGGWWGCVLGVSICLNIV